MAKLHISEKFPLPLDTVTETLVVYGGKGMGKTNLATVLAEELYKNNLRFSFLDPYGVGWGLQHGKRRGEQGLGVLILGGTHGNIAIEPTAGAVVADLVADESVSTVVDISRRPNGKLWTKGEKIRFVADYGTRLFERQGEKRIPLMQIIDEAGRFIPQTIPHGSPDLARCAGAIEELVEVGRNVATGVTLITQRSARMNKSVSELASCMVAFRTIGPNSVEAVLDWLGAHIPKAKLAGYIEQLRALPRGTALVVSPGWLEFEGVVPIRERETFDSSATPKAGRSLAAPGKAAEPDLEKYKERMAETVERALADDPRELRKQKEQLKQENERLKRELEKAAAKEPKPSPPKTVPILTEKDHERMNKAVEHLKMAVAKTEQTVDKLVSVFKFPSGGGLLGATARGIALEQHKAENPNAGSLLVHKSPSRASVPAAASNGKLGLCERKILTVLAQYPSGRTKTQISTVAGYAHNGGSFNNALGALRTQGYLVGENTGTMHITLAGIDILGPFTPLPTGQRLLEHWQQSLGKAESLILTACAGAYPNALSKQQIADVTGYEVGGGSFNNAIGRLRTLELIHGKGELKASDNFF